MKTFSAYIIFIVVLIFFLRKEGLGRLPAALYVPLCWMVLILSRSFSQWLQLRGDLSGMEAEMEGNPIDAAFLLVLIMLGLGILYLKRIDVSGIIKNNKSLFMLYGFALLSLLWADFPLIAFKRWTKWFGSLIMVLVILSEVDYKGAIKSLIKRCAYALIPLSIVFIKFVPSLGRSYTRSGIADYHGVATQKNQYGILLLICGIYFAWELIVMWRKKDFEALKKIGYVNLLFLVVILWQLFFIDSKTSIICLMLGIGVIFLLGHPFFKKYPHKARNAIIALAIVVALLQHFIDIKGTIISSAGRVPTLTDRTILWTEILKVPTNPLVGTGWDNFWLGDRIIPLWEKWAWHPRNAHNGYLEIYLYLGWTGIALLFFALWAGFKKSAALLISDFEYGCLSLSFFIIALFFNYSESAFHRMSPVWFFGLLFYLVKMPRELKAREPGITLSF